MKPVSAATVFTPSEYPELTYIVRDNLNLERELKRSLAIKGDVVSVSGPSKSGKTVLIERVIGPDDLITVSGASIRKAQDLWDLVLDWMDVPLSVTTTATKGGSEEVTVGVKGKLGIPFVASGEASAAGTATTSRSNADTEARPRRGMTQVVEEIGGSDYVIFIDDFHYMPREIQKEVAKQIKAAAGNRVKFVVASVPHRSDDVVRANPELRGRTSNIDLRYWDIADLIAIGEAGFPRLNMLVERETLKRLAEECSGSPQLMQAVCLGFCYEVDVEHQLVAKTAFPLEEKHLEKILRKTTSRTDFGGLVSKMHGGPRTRGTERKEFNFIDGSKGDVYRCLLLAIGAPPSELSFDWKKLSSRITEVSRGGSPNPQSVYLAASQSATMALNMFPDQRVLEWDNDNQLLDIVDPYFLFYLRWSDKMESLRN
jgi:hypothetical protein